MEMSFASSRPSSGSAVNFDGLQDHFRIELGKKAHDQLPRYETVMQAAQSLRVGAREAKGLAERLFVAQGADGSGMWANTMAAQFLEWRQDNEDKTVYGYLAGILKLTCDHFAIGAGHPLLPAAVAASVLGEVHNNLPFHSAGHTREVVALAVALAAQQDRLDPFDDPQTQSLEIFIAACIHDYAHDGFGNARYGQHTPMRLEQNALDHALPYLKMAGIPDPSWERICVMVLATDVSKPAASYTSPAEWMRLAFGGAGAGGDCPPFLAPLFDDPSLSLQAAILEDADLGVSGGLPYEFSRRMTALIAQETKVLTPSPETLIGFIDHICHNKFMTAAAAALFGDNMERLRAAAEKESVDTIYQWS